MEIVGLLLAPIVLASFIWLLVAGFRKSLAWGFWLVIGSLLISLIAIFLVKPNNIVSISLVFIAIFIPAISFAYKNWEDAKKSFLTYFISSVLILLININTLSESTDNNLELLISQVQQGQISEEDAAQSMRAIIQKIEDSSSLSEQEKLIMQTAKNIITQVEENMENDPDFYNPKVNNDYQQDLAKIEAKRKQEESLKKLEERLNKRNLLDRQPKPKKDTSLLIIKKSEIKKYIGSKIIIITIHDIKHKGTLKDFDDETYSVIIEHERKTGVLNFEIHMSDIKTIYLFIDE